ncbi:MAG: Xylose isomerase domain protein barrel [Bacilli bacterium]|nr:Xylose isomerase domain protein barrel [Bacilli bacterium]
MIKGLTAAGIGKVDGLESFIRMASHYGFGAVDTGGEAIDGLITTHGANGARDLLQEQQVRIGSIGLPVEWRKSEEQFLTGLKKLVRHAELAREIGCTSCCTYFLPSIDENPAHFMAIATRRLRTCAQILSAYQLKLGLEFVGPHHLRTKWKNQFIWDAAATLDWIAAIGENNVGLLFDSYHWYTNEMTVADILKLNASQIVHVHINDARPVPIAEVLDNDRLYPGEGVIDLAGFLKALSSIGYQGVVSQEILSVQPPTEPYEVLLRRSAEGFNKVYSLAGLQ